MTTLNFDAFPDDGQRLAAFAQAGPSDEIESGWIPPEKRTNVEEAAHQQVMVQTPPLVLFGKSANENATVAKLWDCWRLARPQGWSGIQQITGSCVGAGGGNMLFSLAAADVVKRRDPERVEVPFWLLPYGISRMLAGMRDRGSGSLGSTFAKAMSQYGHLPATDAGLPAFEANGEEMLVWGREAELDWSQGHKIGRKWLEMARPHIVQTVARCRSTDDVRDAIKNYYGVTCASNWGGLMKPPVKGSGANARLINRRATTWHHQMSVQAWEDTTEHGELFYIFNQWGRGAHGRCPSGAPLGGFWITKQDMADIVSQNEVFAYSQLVGFPALVEPLDFGAF